MNKVTFVLIVIAFISGILIATPQVQGIGHDAIFGGNVLDDEDRPSGFSRYFISGDIMNECIWEIIGKDACIYGILFDNQENINQKLNWLLEQHGFDFTKEFPDQSEELDDNRR